MLVDTPADYDPLLPKYAGWHEGFDAYEFDVDAETWSACLMRCRSCSGILSHVEKRPLTNTPNSETIQT